MKDQYGESPFRNEYANCWQPYVDDSKTILFIIDGGPRHYIANEITKFHAEHPEMQIIIALLDAHRPEYDEVLERYTAAKYFKGSVELVDGRNFYEKEPEKELWIAYLNEQDR